MLSALCKAVLRNPPHSKQVQSISVIKLLHLLLNHTCHCLNYTINLTNSETLFHAGLKPDDNFSPPQEGQTVNFQNELDVQTPFIHVAQHPVEALLTSVSEAYGELCNLSSHQSAHLPFDYVQSDQLFPDSGISNLFFC